MIRRLSVLCILAFVLGLLCGKRAAYPRRRG
jgi:hypothetical protein